VLEEAEDGENGKKRKSRSSARYTQMLLFDPGSSSGNQLEANRPSPVEAALKKLNVEEITPIEALNKLYELKKLLN